MNTRTVFIVTGAAVLFLAGWGASDIIRAYRVIITNIDGEARVTIGTDSLGNGHLVIKDWEGNTTFEVKGKT